MLLLDDNTPAIIAAAAQTDPAQAVVPEGIKAVDSTISTVKDSLTVLRMILRYGQKRGAWPSADFTVHFSTQSKQEKNLSTLTRGQQSRLYRYLTRNCTHRNLGILICLHSGLRIGEVCGLQWKDLDAARGVIHVNKTVQRIYIADADYHEYTLSVDIPKTPSSIRDIPMSGELRKQILVLKKHVRQTDFVLSDSPTPLEPRLYRAYYYRLLRRLCIPPIRFHALRHSFATRCIEGKCDYKTVSAILGHASISTTLDLYVHPGYREKKQVIDRLARML